MPKAIITGAGGFIGGALTEELLNSGYSVIGLDITEPQLTKPYPAFTYRCAGFTDYRHLAGLPECQGADILYHFAWVGVSGEQSEAWGCQLDNVRHACELLEAAQGLGIKRFVYPGSIMEYEHQKAYERGFAPFPQRHHYHVAKQAARHMLRIAADQGGTDFIPLTISNIYGPRDRSQRLINSLIASMLGGKRMALTAGEQLYDFIYMDDAVRAIRLAGEKGEPFREYYIGNRQPRPLKEFLLEAERVVQPAQALRLGEREFTGVSLDYTEFDMGGIYELGFEPSVSFAEGIALTVAARRGGC